LNHLKSHIYIFITILLTVYGQLVIKWQMNRVGTLPNTLTGKLSVLLHMFFNPWVISCLFAGFCVVLSWMTAMTKFDLSYAYPFMSLSFVFVLILSGIFFHEPVTLPKVVGLSLIVIGIIVGSQG